MTTADRKPMRIKLTGCAASELDIRTESPCEADPEELLALFAAWDGSALTVTAETAQTVADGLNTLSNWCDELSVHPSISPEERRANANASRGLSTAWVKALAFSRVAA